MTCLALSPIDTHNATTAQVTRTQPGRVGGGPIFWIGCGVSLRPTVSLESLVRSGRDRPPRRSVRRFRVAVGVGGGVRAALFVRFVTTADPVSGLSLRLTDRTIPRRCAGGIWHLVLGIKSQISGGKTQTCWAEKFSGERRNRSHSHGYAPIRTYRTSAGLI